MPFASLVCAVCPVHVDVVAQADIKNWCAQCESATYEYILLHAPCIYIWWSWGYMCGCAGPAGRRNHACMRVAAAMQCMQAPAVALLLLCPGGQHAGMGSGPPVRSGVVRLCEVSSVHRAAPDVYLRHSTWSSAAGRVATIHPPNLRCVCAIGPSCGWHCTPSCALWCLC